MSKQQLQQEIEALQKQLEEKQKALAAMPDKWEPKGGEWYIAPSGLIDCIGSPMKTVANFGMEYATHQQAEKAAKAMRAHNRLLAYVAEFAPDYEFKPERQNHFVYYSGRKWKVDYTAWRIAGAVYMPEYVAYKFAEKLNSGDVEL